MIKCLRLIHQTKLSSSVRNSEVLFARGASNTACLAQLDWWSRTGSVWSSEILDDSWRDIAAFINQSRLFSYLYYWVLVWWHPDELFKDSLLSALILCVLKVLIRDAFSFGKCDSILLHSFFLQMIDIPFTGCKIFPCRFLEVNERCKFLKIFFLKVYFMMLDIFFFFGFLL